MCLFVFYSIENVAEKEKMGDRLSLNLLKNWDTIQPEASYNNGHFDMDRSVRTPNHLICECATIM